MLWTFLPAQFSWAVVIITVGGVILVGNNDRHSEWYRMAEKFFFNFPINICFQSGKLKLFVLIILSMVIVTFALASFILIV